MGHDYKPPEAETKPKKEAQPAKELAPGEISKSEQKRREKEVRGGGGGESSYVRPDSVRGCRRRSRPLWKRKRRRRLPRPPQKVAPAG
jgi:hypothetical protein